MKKRRKKVVTILIIVGAIVLIGILGFVKGWWWGLTPRSVPDANPTPDLVSQWMLPYKFNPEGYKLWNLDPDFDDYSVNTGLKYNQEIVVTPKGKRGWGFWVYGWSPVDKGEICVKDSIVRIYVKQDRRIHYGNGTIIQGWVWGDPKNQAWHCPRPLRVYKKKIIASIDLKIDRAKSYWWRLPSNWLMVGVTFWLKSPELKTSKGKTRKLVIDLGLYLHGRMMYTKTGGGDYHYQRVAVLNKKEDIGQWQHYDIDLTWFIKDALKCFNIEHAEKSLKLYSMEALCEIKHGEAEFEVKRFALYYK